MKRMLSIILAFSFLTGSLTACSKEAASTPESAVSVETMSVADYLDLGNKYLSEGNYEEAIIAFTAAIDIDPNNTDAYLGRARTYVAEAKASAPEGIEIINWPEELIALYKQAENDYLKAIGIDQQLVDAYLELADLYMEQGEPQKALEILQKGMDVTGDASIQTKQQELFTPQPLEGYPKTEQNENSDGSYTVFEYNEFGWTVTQTGYNADGSMIYSTEFQYTEFGGLLQMKASYAASGEVSVMEFSGNDTNLSTARNKPLKVTYYQPDGSVRYSTEYTYTDEGYLLTSVTSSELGYELHYSGDELERIIYSKHQFQAEDGSSSGTEEISYSYNEQNVSIQVVHNDSASGLTEFHVTYTLEVETNSVELTWWASWNDSIHFTETDAEGMEVRQVKTTMDGTIKE